MNEKELQPIAWLNGRVVLLKNDNGYCYHNDEPKETDTPLYTLDQAREIIDRENERP